MRLRHSRLLVAMIVILGAAWGAISAQSPEPRGSASPTGTRSIDELLERIAALEERVQTLEKQLTGVHPAAGTTIPAPSLAVPYDPKTGRVPPTWVPGEINGLRYYTIPLRMQQTAQESN